MDRVQTYLRVDVLPWRATTSEEYEPIMCYAYVRIPMRPRANADEVRWCTSTVSCWASSVIARGIVVTFSNEQIVQVGRQQSWLIKPMALEFYLVLFSFRALLTLAMD